MKRILLLTEDFNEMTFLETLLKKLGFDTLGIQNPNQAGEKTLAINPEMLILSDFIKGQSTHQILQNLVESRPNMHVILMKGDFHLKTDHEPEFINKSVKSPVDPVDFIKSICSVAGLDQEQYLDKYYKLGLFKGDPNIPETVTVKGKIAQVSETRFIKSLKGAAIEKTNADRKKRFESQIQSLSKPKAEAVSHKLAMDEVKEFRQRTNDSEIKKIDEQRQGFVRALFKKD